MKGRIPAQGGESDGREARVHHNGPGQERFAIVPVGVLDLDLSKPALRLFIAMSAHADRQQRLCYASQETLAEECGWWYGAAHPDRRCVRRHLDELEVWGCIREAGRHVWSDGHWTRQYVVMPYGYRTDGEQDSPTLGREGTDGDRDSPTYDPHAEGTMARFGAPDGEISSIAMASRTHRKQRPTTDPNEHTLLRVFQNRQVQDHEQGPEREPHREEGPEEQINGEELTRLRLKYRLSPSLSDADLLKAVSELQAKEDPIPLHAE